MNNQLTEINEGSTHENNKNGGVPLNGNNTVEEGETINNNGKNKYVYSNRLSIDENMTKNMNLPSYVKGKTFADASKAINNKFKDRNDKPSLETRKTLLGRLTNAQEQVKAQREAEAAKINEALQVNSQEVPDQMNGQIPEGMEEFMPEQNQMFLGGELGAEGTDMTGGIQGGIQALTQLSAGNDSQAGKTALKTGLTLGANALFPGAGMAVGPIFDIADNIIGGNSAKRAQQRLEKRQAFKASNQYGTDFAYGGNINKMEDGGPVPIDDSLEGYTGNLPMNTRPLATSLSGMLTPASLKNTPTSLSTTEMSNYKTADTSNIPTQDSFLTKAGNYLDKNGGKFLKYAPVAMNAYQLSQLKKPKYERLDRLSNTYKPSYVDERALQNIVSNENDNTINALTNSSNGSVGALRSNLLGANINYTKALSDSYLKANEANNAQNQYKQQFDLGVNQANMAQSNVELDINDRNSAAYRNEKSKYLASIGTDLGAIGKEEINKNQIAEALGYTVNGDYVINKKTGEKKTYKQMIADQNSAPVSFGDVNKFIGTSVSGKMFGGYLQTNKKGY